MSPSVRAGLAGLGAALAAASLPAAGSVAGRLALSKAELGHALAAGLWTYALSAAFNGVLADRFGGRRALIAGAGGTLLVALAGGGLAALGRESAVFAGIATLYAAARYFQSFTLAAAAKLGAARSPYGALAFPGELLALPLALWLAPRLQPAVLALLPAAAAALALAAALGSERAESAEPALSTRELLRDRWVAALAAAEACAGFARWGLLGWAAQFLVEVHGVRPEEPAFAGALLAAAGGACAGPLLCGALSDKAFKGRRTPAAAVFFGLAAAAMGALGRAPGWGAAVACLAAACAGLFGVHSILAGAAAMTAGDKRSSGSVAGLLDAAHHAAGGLSGLIVGALLERGGWGAWTGVLIPFCLAGGALMLLPAALRVEARDPRL